MIEYEINGQQYRSDKLSAMDQFHVSRKLAPVLPTIVPVIQAAAKGELDKVLAGGDSTALAVAAAPFAEALATMPDDHAECIINSCLKVTWRKQGDVWSSLSDGKTIMYDDIDMSVMLPVMVRVLRESLAGFISGLAMNQSSPATPSNGENSPAAKAG